VLPGVRMRHPFEVVAECDPPADLSEEKCRRVVQQVAAMRGPLGGLKEAERKLEAIQKTHKL
jgi:hypothetical protein